MASRKRQAPPQVSLIEWARTHFADVPHIVTLRRWARTKHIEPAPQRVGRDWKVDPGARYVAQPSTEKAKA